MKTFFSFQWRLPFFRPISQKNCVETGEFFFLLEITSVQGVFANIYVVNIEFHLFQHDNLPATGYAQLSNYCKSIKFALVQQVFERLPLLICVQFLNHVTMLHHTLATFWLVHCWFSRRICLHAIFSFYKFCVR